MVSSVHQAGWSWRGPEEGLGVRVHTGCRLPARDRRSPGEGPAALSAAVEGERTHSLTGTGCCVSCGRTSAFGSQNEPCPRGPAGPWKDLGPPREAGRWVTRPPCSSQPGQVQLCLCLTRGPWIRVCSQGAFKRSHVVTFTTLRTLSEVLNQH